MLDLIAKILLVVAFVAALVKASLFIGVISMSTLAHIISLGLA